MSDHRLTDAAILVKASSRLIRHPDLYPRLREQAEESPLRAVGGGGEQINEEFRKRGWPIEFGTFGRICVEEEHKDEAALILKRNADILEDQFRRARLPVEVIVPVMSADMGRVTCHVNGDFYPIIGYNGYKRSLVFTAMKDVERKRRWYAWLWQISKFHLGDGGEIPLEYKLDPNDFPERIEVIGLNS